MDTLKKNNENKILQIKTNKHLKVTKNYGKKLNWSQIETLNDDEPVEYRKDFMKIKFESDDDLPLGKTFQYYWHDNCCCNCSWTQR